MIALFYVSLFFAATLLLFLAHLIADAKLRRYDERLSRLKGKYQTAIASSKNGALPKRLLRKLKHAVYLQAFSEAASSLPKRDLERLLRVNKDEIIRVISRSVSPTIHAAFAAILCSLSLSEKEDHEGYDALVESFLTETVYARANAIKCICSFGEPEAIAGSFLFLTKEGQALHPKILLDALMNSPCDPLVLGKALMKHFGSYDECYQVASINYCTQKKVHVFDRSLNELLYDGRFSLDVDCAILRKLGANQSEDNRARLLFALERFHTAGVYEPASVAAHCLGSFIENEETKAALRKALSSKNWFVRVNSANSLVKLGLKPHDRDSIYMSADRYAVDALEYAIANAKEGN